MDNNIDKAIQEILHAQSALNMEPKPLPKSEGTYLSETDYWVKHSYIHLDNVLKILINIQNKKE